MIGERYQALKNEKVKNKQNLVKNIVESEIQIGLDGEVAPRIQVGTQSTQN